MRACLRFVSLDLGGGMRFGMVVGSQAPSLLQFPARLFVCCLLRCESRVYCICCTKEIGGHEAVEEIIELVKAGFV